MLTGLDRQAPDRLTLSAAANAAATAQAASLDRRLGLPVPASQVAERLADPVTGLIVDEVRDLDPLGQPIGISRFDPSGQLVSAVQLGFVAPATTVMTTAAVMSRATAVAASAGVTVSGAATTTPRAAGGWLVRWVRTIAGVPVPGDGVSVQLAGDGSFHGVVRTEHPLAAPPVALLSEAQARTLAGARLDAWFTGALHGQATISSLALAWVAPNDSFDDPLPTAPAGTLRLAWVVRVTSSGALADRFAGLELAFDAGDGTPLGGDVLE
ncbi:MAG TPA: hypothetical protein VKR24_12265 [Candidatus Limnocylindrales bacterium]|nr:hypothetical protein [Candidatus Limnocylindrales bacterium]